ncbi:sulfite exporter TauE/SafE family protein [Sphingobacterium multivorum]|uniref:Probable membrane transporter protein n=1 Tax=Sphingobacterium multivorum TaxID=28454 RepID=A0ABX7CQD9_SPHMU|nr:sulfite exporter TauE/SafE family protein [Sphingobacterium multivorum]QQT31081.1 sulfite exporter TauE/SafE family protein [Sphingobacterium multivorum]QQT52986.1 sulfite exporter TauE/SafE family protein [Sphingobacterium multivorum]
MELIFIAGFILAVLVGLSMGLMGSGGSILTLPIFVYIFHIEPQYALDYSLFSIGILALVGSISPLKKREIDLKTTAIFLFPSLISVYLTKRYLLVAIPESFHLGEIAISRNHIIMFLFSIVILISATAMVRRRKQVRHDRFRGGIGQIFNVVLVGLLVGILTGLVGAGGGFIIVPALVLLLGIPLKQAIATSLFIIGLNASFGLIANYQFLEHMNWFILVTFTLITLIGLQIGSKWKDKLDAAKLKGIFGYFLISIGILIFAFEFIQFVNY